MDIWLDILKYALYAVIIFGATLVTAVLTVMGDRRLSALLQDRYGPNRIGPLGLFQLVADLIKLVFKEDRVIDGADRWLGFIGPLLAFIPGFIVVAFMPFGTTDGMTSLTFIEADVATLFILAIGALSAYGIAYGGWASNSKFSLIGGIRSSAQIISFEIAMGLAIAALILSIGNASLSEIVAFQVGTNEAVLQGRDGGEWFWWAQPIAFLVFLVAAFAETNRTPFDFPEAEQELVGGYHTEYSAMKFGSYMFGEYTAVVAMSAMMATLFLGGWDIGIDAWFLPDGQNLYMVIHEALDGNTWAVIINVVLSIGVVYTKVWLFIWLFIWVRWTIPRLKWTMLMNMGWKALIPLALVNIFLTGLVRYLVDLNEITWW